MLEEFDSDSSTAGYNVVGEFTRADEQKILDSFREAKAKSPEEIRDLLIDYCLDDLGRCSSATLKSLFRLSLTVYRAFVIPAVVDALSRKACVVLAQRSVELLKEKTITGSREDFPTRLILLCVFHKSETEPFLSIAIQRLSEELLDKNTSSAVRLRLWEALDFLPAEAIERCVTLWVKQPSSQKSECLLQSTIPKYFNITPNVEFVFAKQQFHWFIQAISLAQLKTYLMTQLADVNENNLRQLQLLIIYLLRATSDTDPAIFSNMLVLCLIHLMNFSEPREGLKLREGILKECLSYLHHNFGAGDLRRILLEKHKKNKHTLLSYIRRTIKDFNPYSNIQFFLLCMDGRGSMAQLSDAELATESQLGYIDVQSLLCETATRSVFDEKRAQRLVDVCDANMDLAHVRGSNFLELALYAAGRECDPTEKPLDFYLRNKIRQGAQSVELVTRYLEKIIDTAPIFFSMMHFTRGAIRLIQKLCAKYNVTVSSELIQRVQALAIPDGYKHSVLAAITTRDYQDPGLPPLPDEPVVAEIRAVAQQSSAAICSVLEKHLDTISESYMAPKKILRLSLNVYLAMIQLFNRGGLSKARIGIAINLAEYAFQLYCEGKIKYVESQMPSELVSFLVRDKMSELVQTPELYIENEFGGFFYQSLVKVDNFAYRLTRTLYPGEPEHLEKLQLLIGYLLECLSIKLDSVYYDLYVMRLANCLLYLIDFSLSEEGLKLSPSLLRQCLKYLNNSFGISILKISRGRSPVTLLGYVRRSVGDLTAFPFIDDYCRTSLGKYSVFECEAEKIRPLVESGVCDIQRELLRITNAPYFHELKTLHLMSCGANLDVVQEGKSFCSLALIEAGKMQDRTTDKIQFYLHETLKRNTPTTLLALLVETLMRSHVQSQNAKYWHDYFRGYLYVIQLLVLDYGAIVTPEMVEGMRALEIPVAFSYTCQIILGVLKSALAFDPFRDCKTLERLRRALGKSDNYLLVNALVTQLGGSLKSLLPHEKKQLCEHPVGVDRREFLIKVDDDFKELIGCKVAVEVLVAREAQRLRVFQTEDSSKLDENKLPNRSLFGA